MAKVKISVRIDEHLLERLERRMSKEARHRTEMIERMLKRFIEE